MSACSELRIFCRNNSVAFISIRIDLHFQCIIFIFVPDDYLEPDFPLYEKISVGVCDNRTFFLSDMPGGQVRRF